MKSSVGIKGDYLVAYFYDEQGGSTESTRLFVCSDKFSGEIFRSANENITSFIYRDTLVYQSDEKVIQVNLKQR